MEKIPSRESFRTTHRALSLHYFCTGIKKIVQMIKEKNLINLPILTKRKIEPKLNQH